MTFKRLVVASSLGLKIPMRSLVSSLVKSIRMGLGMMGSKGAEIRCCSGGFSMRSARIWLFRTGIDLGSGESVDGTQQDQGR